MKIHPDILIHWTPRRRAAEVLTPELRSFYVEHLKSICKTGLRFSEPETPESIRGVNQSTTLPSLPMLCFTELRLSMVAEHIQRYGRLGIGFRQSYLREQGANPVFYMQNANQGIVNTNLQTLGAQTEKLPGLEVFLSYIKGMSQEVDGELDYYDEMEWRIVGCNIAGRCPFKRDGNGFIFDFQPTDIELLVFPDADTRREAMADQDIQAFFGDDPPMMLDAPDVGSI